MKKFISCLLVFTLLIGMMPLTVFAQDADEDGGRHVLTTAIDHKERGHEVIVVRQYFDYVFLSYFAHFEIQVTNDQGTQTYVSESILIPVWSKDSTTVEQISAKDDNMTEVYPLLEKAAINELSERMLGHMSADELKKELFDDVVRSWYDAEVEAIAETVAIEFVKSDFVFKDVMQNIVEKGFDIKAVADSANKDESMEEAVEFAKTLMKWLDEIAKGIESIIAFFQGVNVGAIGDLENLFSPPGEDYTKYKSKIAEDKLAYHEAVNELING